MRLKPADKPTGPRTCLSNGQKPATPATRTLRFKLETLVARGVNGEIDAAQVKLARLLARYDFNAPAQDLRNLFAGVFIKSSIAEPVTPLDSGAMDVASFAKWAVEARCDIPCLFKDGQLWAQADRKTAKKLGVIVGTFSGSLLALWNQFKGTPGVNALDRGVFLRGLYDGAMGEEAHEALPVRMTHSKAKRAKKKDVAYPAGITAHPYSIALALGKQITLCVPLPEIQNQLSTTIRGELTDTKPKTTEPTKDL